MARGHQPHVAAEDALKHRAERTRRTDVGVASVSSGSSAGSRSTSTEIPPRAGVETVVADFNDFEPRRRFDLVLCLQVLEHLDRPRPFARKLLGAGRTTIISVPHEWPGWVTEEHVHDPVDESKLRAWTGRDPTETAIVEDLGMERLIAVYR